jgi:hypothetical protein
MNNCRRQSRTRWPSRRTNEQTFGEILMVTISSADSMAMDCRNKSKTADCRKRSKTAEYEQLVGTDSLALGDLPGAPMSRGSANDGCVDR